MSGAPLVKPAKRGPRPRKPIQRSKTPIARNKRPPRVSARPARQEELRKDREWSKAVKASGICLALGTSTRWQTDTGHHDSFHHSECFGRLEAAHIMGRGYAATRHDKSNGLPLCAGAHGAFTRHPEGWKQFVIDRIGEPAYEALRQKAVAGSKA